MMMRCEVRPRYIPNWQLYLSSFNSSLATVLYSNFLVDTDVVAFPGGHVPKGAPHNSGLPGTKEDSGKDAHCAGIGPDTWFPARRKSARELILPRSGGIVEERLLADRSRDSRLDRLVKLSGMAPSNWFPATEKFSMAVKPP